jgi:hypothetical protein
LHDLRQSHFVAAFNLARIYSGMGQTEQASFWLAQACQERSGELVFLDRETKVGVGLAFGRELPKTEAFHALMQSHGLIP